MAFEDLNLGGVGRQIGSSLGLQALYRRPQGSGIDFMAFARGAQIARDQSWQERLRQEEADRMRLRGIRRQDAEQGRRDTLTANRYLSTLPENRQRGMDAGLSSTELFLEQRRDIVEDGGFQGLAQGAQSQVLAQLKERGTLLMDRLAKAGRMQEAAQVARGIGLIEPFSQRQIQLRNASADETLQIVGDALGFGAPDANGNVMVAGVEVPASSVVALAKRNPEDFSSVYTLAAALDAERRNRLALAGPPTAVGGAAVPQTGAAPAGQQPVIDVPYTPPEIPVAQPAPPTLSATLGLPDQPGLSELLAQSRTPTAAAAAQFQNPQAVPSGLEQLQSRLETLEAIPTKTLFEMPEGLQTQYMAQAQDIRTAIENLANLPLVTTNFEVDEIAEEAVASYSNPTTAKLIATRDPKQALADLKKIERELARVQQFAALQPKTVIPIPGRGGLTRTIAPRLPPELAQQVSRLTSARETLQAALEAVQ